jgi:hypothetical protein
MVCQCGTTQSCASTVYNISTCNRHDRQHQSSANPRHSGGPRSTGSPPDLIPAIDSPLLDCRDECRQRQDAQLRSIFSQKTIIGLHVLKRDHMQRLNQAVGSLSLARFVHILRRDNVERSFKKLIISHTNCQKMHDPILSAYSTHPATTIGRYNGSNKSDSILYRTA